VDNVKVVRNVLAFLAGPAFAEGCGTGQHTENLTSTPCVWNPACSGLPCGRTADQSSQEATEAMDTFFPCSQIPVFRHHSDWSGGLKSPEKARWSHPSNLACVHVPSGL